MTFHEKLARRVFDLGLNKAKAARDVGLPESTINSYLSKPDSIPRADIALKLASALQVRVEWLIDDTREEWPPPAFDSDAARPLNELPDSQLLGEIARRYRLAALDLLAEHERAKSIDWARAADVAERLQPGDPLPDHVRRALAVMRSIELKSSRLFQDFDAAFYAVVHHDELPGRDRSPADFEHVGRGFAWGEVADVPHVRKLAALLAARPDWHDTDTSGRMAAFEQQVKRYYEALQAKSESPPLAKPDRARRRVQHD